MILKDNNEGMQCLFIFLKRKKCICGAFQLDAAVPEKHLYILFSLRGYCNRHRPSVSPSVFMLSPPKPLDEIQLNLVCELLT